MSILLRINQKDSDLTITIDSDNAEVSHCDNTNKTLTFPQTIANDLDIVETVHQPLLVEQQQREIDTFMRNNNQYFRVGQTFGRILIDDTMETISSSCYYDNRKKANCEQK